MTKDKMIRVILDLETRLLEGCKAHPDSFETKNEWDIYKLTWERNLRCLIEAARSQLKFCPHRREVTE